MNKVNYQIDDLDRQILSFLMEDSRMAYTEIAKKLLVSPGTIHVRMGKMEAAGIVESATLRLNTRLLGFDIVAFMGLHLGKGGTFESVIPELRKINEVVEAHYTTGVYGIFLKLVCKNTDHMRDVIKEQIQPIEGIEKSETFISLDASIDRELSL
jgi:Lrp/AsnC family transcriptional regulator for asnA, asnC and gidA